MMRGILTISTFASLILLPWPCTVVLALAAACIEPLVPFAVGVLADTLYFIPHGTALPLASLAGLLVTLLALFVHSRLRTGSMQE